MVLTLSCLKCRICYLDNFLLSSVFPCDSVQHPQPLPLNKSSAVSTAIIDINTPESARQFNASVSILWQLRRRRKRFISFSFDCAKITGSRAAPVAEIHSHNVTAGTSLHTTHAWLNAR